MDSLQLQSSINHQTDSYKKARSKIQNKLYNKDGTFTKESYKKANSKYISQEDFLNWEERKIIQEQEKCNFQLALQNNDSSALLKQQQQQDFLFQQMRSRLCKYCDPYFYKRKCEDCAGDFDKLDKEGNPLLFKITCGSPYCKDEECLNSRLFVARLCIKSYFLYYKTWRAKRQRWLHFTISHKRIKKPKKEDLLKQRKNLNQVLKYIKDEFNNPHLLGVQDISHNTNGFHFHNHFAMRLRNINEEKLNAFCFSKDMKYTRQSITGAPNLINYFAKRYVGMFEHKSKGTDWMFADKFTEREYFNLFYRTKRFISKGFNTQEIKKIKEKIREGLIDFEEVVTCNYTNNRMNKICPSCQSSSFLRVRVNKEGKIPPPCLYELENAISEVISIGGVRCNRCNQTHEREDHNFKKGMCQICNLHNSFEFQKSRDKNSLPEVRAMNLKLAEGDLKYRTFLLGMMEFKP